MKMVVCGAVADLDWWAGLFLLGLKARPVDVTVLLGSIFSVLRCRK